MWGLPLDILKSSGAQTPEMKRVFVYNYAHLPVHIIPQSTYEITIQMLRTQPYTVLFSYRIMRKSLSVLCINTTMTDFTKYTTCKEKATVAMPQQLEKLKR